MPPDLRVFSLGGGRDLAWLEVGDPDGTPVLAFHGSPGRCYEFALYDRPARQHGVRVVAIDRPGYGHSSYVARRRLADFPASVAQLADHLGLERFAVVGHSAGGPHAVACARFLPDRLTAAAVMSGVAPPGTAGADEGLLPTNRVQVALYRRWPPALDPLAAALGWVVSPLVDAMLGFGRRDPEKGIGQFAGMLPPCDAAVLARPDVRAPLRDEVVELGPSVLRAAVQDMALISRDWGFDVGAIEVPVHLWHGDQDRNVPLANGARLAADIPGARLHECRGEGHWLIVDHLGEALEVLAGYAPA